MEEAERERKREWGKDLHFDPCWKIVRIYFHNILRSAQAFKVRIQAKEQQKVSERIQITCDSSSKRVCPTFGCSVEWAKGAELLILLPLLAGSEPVSYTLRPQTHANCKPALMVRFTLERRK